ncbi:hypothetical protein S245_066949, partial [Arachis hypogaea]
RASVIWCRLLCNFRDYVLALTVENFLEHRLQTFVFKFGVAKSIHHAMVLIRQRHIASSRFANNNNNDDALVPATKNINRPSMVVNVKVLKKLFSVNNFQKKPRRRGKENKHKNGEIRIEKNTVWTKAKIPAIAVRKAVKTEMIDPEPMEKPPPLLSKQGYDAALDGRPFCHSISLEFSIRIQVKSGNKVSDYSNASLKNYAVWANSADDEGKVKAVLQAAFTHLMSANKERVTEAVNSLKFRLHDESKDISEQFNHTNSLKLIARAHLAIRHPASGYRKFLIEADCYWCLSKLLDGGLMIPKKGNIYSVNKGNAKNWEKPITENVDNCMFPQDGSSPKSLRYVGSMVVDIHRTLLYGGIFMYLVDKKNPDGKLRLQLQMSTCLASKESQKVEVAIGIIRRSSQ